MKDMDVAVILLPLLIDLHHSYVEEKVHGSERPPEFQRFYINFLLKELIFLHQHVT